MPKTPADYDDMIYHSFNIKSENDLALNAWIVKHTMGEKEKARK